MNPTLRIFLFGVVGALAVELLKILTYYETGRPFPVRYKRRGFWFARAILVMIGGAVAVAHEVPTAILAIHIGAATPAIIQTFARKPPENEDLKTIQKDSLP
jgi:hypothetical protein